MKSLATTAWVDLGGALGSIARYWIAVLALPLSRTLPWVPETARLFVTVGICGGFTTLLSFSLQTLDPRRAGAWSRALLNVALSVLLCLAAVAAGHVVASQYNDRARAVAQSAIEEEA